MDLFGRMIGTLVRPVGGSFVKLLAQVSRDGEERSQLPSCHVVVQWSLDAVEFALRTVLIRMSLRIQWTNSQILPFPLPEKHEHSACRIEAGAVSAPTSG